MYGSSVGEEATAANSECPMVVEAGNQGEELEACSDVSDNSDILHVAMIYKMHLISDR